MIKTIFIFLSMAFSAGLLQAQDQTAHSNRFAKSSVDLELMGTGSMYSLNFDRILVRKGDFGLVGRVGITYSPVIEGVSDIGGPGIPFALAVLYGQNKNKLEVGLGGAYHYLFDEPDVTHFFILVPRIGYRNQKPEGGFFYRIAFTPWIPVVIDEDIERRDLEPGFVPMVGFSLGYSFIKSK